MSAISLNEEQTQLLRLCLKHAEPIKPNWQPVAEGLGHSVSTNAASQRWGRLYKILVGDNKPSTPSKAKDTKSNTANETPTRKRANPKKSTTNTAQASPEDSKDAVKEQELATEPTTPTSQKKRGLESDATDEAETPSKMEKVEIKEEE